MINYKIKILVILFISISFVKGGSHPNVVFIICDDLNDYTEALGGHPQAKTPNLSKFAESGVRFTNACSNNPVCAPSRASLLSGIYPHNSGQFFFEKWSKNKVFKGSKMMHEHFRDNGYQVLSTGKVFHHDEPSFWKGMEQYQSADYGPFAFDGEKRQGNPFVPKPFRELGPVVGSFGPLSDVPYKDSGAEKAGWVNGNWKTQISLNYKNENERGLTPDESNANWAVDKIQKLKEEGSEKPFFMTVGFVRPHTPLHAPQKYFDMFPLDEIILPNYIKGDIDDTFYYKVNDKNKSKGHKHYRYLRDSYKSFDEGLRYFTQAYLACVAAADDCIGQVVDAIDNSPFKDNTIVIVTSDHGWHMGEKEYIAKNTPWSESVKVPMIVRAPKISEPGVECNQPISLIDIYPTLVDLCGLEGKTVKNENGHSLDGKSIRLLLEDPKGNWEGPESALTMVYAGKENNGKVDRQHYSLLSKKYRYIRYNSGDEELYDQGKDPHEWLNLALSPEYKDILIGFRNQLREHIGAGL